jgi:hypothetical protein
MSRPACCSLCWVERGEKTEPMKGWDGVPLCRQHVAACIAANLPAITALPTMPAPSMLQ